MRKNTIRLITMIVSTVSISSFAASPDDGDNLFVYTKEFTKVVIYSLDNLDKLTFDDTSMSVWTNLGKTVYDYDDISLLTFRDGVRPIAGIKLLTINNDVQICYNRETMLVSVQSIKPLTGLVVFDVQGRMVNCPRNGNSLQLSLANLPRGLYIVKAQGDGFEESVRIIK